MPMENYKILKELGSGPFGSVFLAESKLDKLRYAIKRIECHDESSANKAFKESLKLFSIRHPFAAQYREIFVDWSSEQSSVYVCFVMDYFSNGSLDSIINRKVADGQPLDEEVVRKWFGQTIEFLAFLHSQNVCHGDVRTSNIFLRDDLSVSVGDFCVATLMADHQTNTRRDASAMDLAAPEVEAGQPATYSLPADVWGLGTCLLSLLTCSKLSLKAVTELVRQAKADEGRGIAEALATQQRQGEGEGEGYSPELIAACQQLLCLQQEQRISVASLLELPVVRECLNLAGSAMADRRRKQEVTTADRPVPSSEGAEAVMQYLASEINNENCFREGLESLCGLLKLQGDVTAEQLRMLQQGVSSHMASPEVCTAYCCLLGNLSIRNSATGGPLHSSASVQSVVQSMRQHPYNASLQRAACALLMTFASDRRCSQLVGELGGVAALLEAVKAAPRDPDLFVLAANALWTLCAFSPNVELCLRLDALLLTTKAMAEFGEVPEVQEQGSALLLALSMSPWAAARAAELRVVELLLMALQGHASYTKVARNCALALASFVEADEECGLLALDCETQRGDVLAGLRIFSEIFAIHRDNVEVAEALAGVFFELAKYAEMVKSVVDLNDFVGAANQIRKRFLKTPAVAQPLEAAMRTIENARFAD